MKLTNATKSELYLYMTLKIENYDVFYVVRNDGYEELYVKIGEHIYGIEEYNEKSQDYLLNTARKKRDEAELRVLFDKSKTAMDLFLKTENRHYRSHIARNHPLFFRTRPMQIGGNLI